MSHLKFSKGDPVEVIADPGKSSIGPYFPATVIHSPASNKSLVFVEYQSLLDTQESRSGARKRLRQFVHLDNVRPIPSLKLNQPYKLGDNVDAYRDNGWSCGIIMDILENSKYLVLFHGEGEEIVCEQCNLRLHTDWDRRFSVPPLKEEEEQEVPSNFSFFCFHFLINGLYCSISFSCMHFYTDFTSFSGFNCKILLGLYD